MNKIDPIEAARQAVNLHFPACSIALLSGSVLLHATPTSDLDIVVFDDTYESPYRKSFKCCGWPVEVFVLNRDSYRFYFDESIYSAVPSILRMCADGIALRGEVEAADIIREAQVDLTAGPAPWTSEEFDYYRYQISETIEDLKGNEYREEQLFIASRLILLTTEFALRANRQWIGEGKWMGRCLRQYSPSASAALLAATDAIYKHNNIEPLIRFATEQLTPYGGLLFEGYGEQQLNV